MQIIKISLSTYYLAPTPASSQNILGTPCKDNRVNRSEPGGNKWYYSRGRGACTAVDMNVSFDGHHQAYQVVYTFQVNVLLRGT